MPVSPDKSGLIAGIATGYLHLWHAAPDKIHFLPV